MVWIQKNGQLIHVYGDAASLNEDGTYTILEYGDGPEIRAAKTRRAALLEEVVEAIEYAQQVMHLFANPLGFNDNSQARQKYTNLIARVRAEWGQG